jgi:hypothetical protein
MWRMLTVQPPAVPDRSRKGFTGNLSFGPEYAGTPSCTTMKPSCAKVVGEVLVIGGSQFVPLPVTSSVKAEL